MSDTRYSKEQLLDMFRAQHDRGSQPNVEDFLIEGWNPKDINGTGGAPWGRHDDRKDVHGPETCWDQDGSVHPLGLIPLTEEEREVTYHGFCFHCRAHKL